MKKYSCFVTCLMFSLPWVSRAVEDDSKRQYKALNCGNMGLLFGINPLKCSDGLNVQNLFKKGKMVCNQDGPASAGSQVRVTYVESSQELAQALGLGGSMNYDATFASFEANVQSDLESCIGLNQVTAVIKAYQVFGIESYENYGFDEAKIADMSDEEIYRICSDEIIVRQQRTAEFYVLISLTNSSQCSKSTASSSLGFKAPGVGGGSVNARMFDEMKKTTADVKIEFVSHGLGNLSSAKEAIRAAILNKAQSVDAIMNLANDQFKQCCLQHGKPSIFFTEPTRKLLWLVRRGNLNQELNQAHPQLSQVLWLAKDMRQTASALVGLCQGQEPRSERRRYFAPFIPKYQKAQGALVALARRLYSDSALPQQDLPNDYELVQRSPVRIDWCPYIDAYDSIEESSYFRTRLRGDRIMLFDYKVKCVMPFISLKDGTVSDPRRSVDPKAIMYVEFDTENFHEDGVFNSF